MAVIQETNIQCLPSVKRLLRDPADPAQPPREGETSKFYSNIPFRLRIYVMRQIWFKKAMFSHPDYNEMQTPALMPGCAFGPASASHYLDYIKQI